MLSNEMVAMRRMFDLISEASGAKRVETILTPEQMQAMPQHRFAQSEGLQRYFGERFVRTYADVKRTEQDRFYGVIADVDYDWYLRSA